MQFANLKTATRYARPASILFGLLLVLAAGVVWFSSGTDVAGQESTVRVTPLDWPPFVATYETDTEPLSVAGVELRGREVHQIEWNAIDDWRVEVLSSPDLGGYNSTGTYWEQRGQHYETYDARFDYRRTESLGTHHYKMPPAGEFFPYFFGGHDFDTRTDGELVILNVEYCDGPNTDCESSSGGASGGSGARSASDPSGPTLLQGRRFEETPVTLSDDPNRIPLEVGHVRVTKLHTNPPDPTATPTPTPTATPTPTPTATPTPTPTATATPTPTPTGPVPDVSVRRIAETDFILSWDALTGVSSYVVEWREGDGDWNYLSTYNRTNAGVRVACDGGFSTRVSVPNTNRISPPVYLTCDIPITSQ